MTDRKILPFSETDYEKLQYDVFPTIRRRDKYGYEGELVTITHGKRGSRIELGTARIISKQTITLSELTNRFLCYDTQSRTLTESVESLNSFYQNAIDPEEELTLYWNQWVNRVDE